MNKIYDLLEKTSLKGMKQKLEEELIRSEREGIPAKEVIERLLLAEQNYREEKRIENRRKEAKIPWEWTISSFPFGEQPGVNKMQIQSLSGLSFMERAENIVFIGETGRGKTGLAVGLLRNAIANGYKGRFYPAQELLDELYASLADRSTQQLLKRLSRIDLLVIDELGYLTLKPEQVNAFFQLIDSRYGRKSTIITTNLKYEDWYELFKRKQLVDALLDRLEHRCITINIKGPSLRRQGDEEKSKKK